MATTMQEACKKHDSCIVVAACNAAIDTRQAVYAKRRVKAKQKQSKKKGEQNYENN